MDKLTNLIKTYYEDQVTSCKSKKIEGCAYPCVPLAQIPNYLRSQGVDWRINYGYDKLTELIQTIEGISVYHKGVVPYIYIEETDFKQTSPSSNVASPSATDLFKSPKATSCTEVKPYEIRKAYRKLAKNAGEWVPIVQLMHEVGWTGKPVEFTSKYQLQYNPNYKSVRVHNISRYEMLDDIYFDPEKNNFQSNINKLRSMALDENWDEQDKRNGLLENYLFYTYARLKDENKISTSQDKLYACWNTGLVDYRYEPIYCYMTRKDTKNRWWTFQDFCVNGEDMGKEMGRNISEMPKPAMYFKEGNLLCQPNENNLSVDRDHIIREHPSRLPLEWLKQMLPEEAEWQPNETSDQYDKRISALLPKGSPSNLFLQVLLKQTIDESIKRSQWNYKTAIPYYDPNNKRMGWFLPLCQRVTKDINGKRTTILDPFAALVVSKGNSGRFQGETIYRLSWAYRCARLVCRPDSDWLTSLFATDDKFDMDE